MFKKSTLQTKTMQSVAAWASGYTDLLIAIGLLLLTVVLFAHVLILGTVPYQRDIGYFYGQEAIVRNASQLGELPLWNPYMTGGMPGLANPQTTVLYPPAVLMRLIQIPLKPYFNWGAIFHLWLAGLGIYILLRHFKVRPIPALLGGLSFMFSGSISPRIHAGHVGFIYAMSWVGWFLWSYICLLERRNYRSFLLTVLFVVLLILSGHFQISLIIIAIAASYFPFFALQCLKENNWRLAVNVFSLSILLGIVASGLLAIQLVPSYELLQQSHRSDGMSIGTGGSYRLTARALGLLVLPLQGYEAEEYEESLVAAGTHIHEYHIYVGMIPLALVPLAFISGLRQKSILTVWLVLLALTGLLLAFGLRLPLYFLLFKLVPIFRGPGRFTVWWTVAAAIATGLGAERLWDYLEKRTCQDGSTKCELSHVVKFVLGATVLAALAFVIVECIVILDPTIKIEGLTPIPQIHPFDFWRLVITIPLAGSSILIWNLSRNRAAVSAGMSVLTLAVIVDMSLFVLPFLTRSAQSTTLLESPLPFTANPATNRVLDKDRGVLGKLTPIVSFDPLLPNTVYNLSKYDERHHLNGYLFSANYFLSYDRPVEGLKFIKRSGNWYWYSLPVRVPRIFAVGQIDWVRDNDKAFSVVTKDGFNPSRQAVVSGNVTSNQNATEHNVNWTAHYTRYETNLVEAEITVDQPALAIFTETYYPGWHAWVDGQRAEIWQTDYAYRGIAISEGYHIIAMRYEPESVRIGGAITGISILALLFASAWILLRPYSKARFNHRKA